MACDPLHSASKTCFCINAYKVAAMMCRQDTVKVMSLPRLLWQSAFWTDLLQSSTYRLTSQIAGFYKVAWTCWAISSPMSSTGLGTQKNRYPARQQSRGLSTVHLKSYLICQACICYILLHHTMCYKTFPTDKASEQNEWCCLSECSCNNASNN